jgi:ATP-dependent exoDNAse (exonuclease V) alpha subunit
LYVFDAEDSIGNARTLLNMEQKYMVASMKADESNQQTGTKRLKHQIEVAIGMKVMVTLNLATEADLANGSRGLIQDIVLDPRETVSDSDRDESGIIWLHYPPAMILFKPYKYQFDPFPGLAPGLIPIFPSEVAFKIQYRNNSMTVHRRQYPLCAAYAFTDHKAQGQTIECVIVDIGPTKRFPVDPFAAYVALS